MLQTVRVRFPVGSFSTLV